METNTDNHVNEAKSNEIKQRVVATGVAYPVYSLEYSLECAKMIVAETGTSHPISKEKISEILKRTVATLGVFYSTLSQYGIFSLVHSKGYLPTDLYRKYTNPVHDNDVYKAKLEMFKSAPLYTKLIDNLNSHQLPGEKGFANLLKQQPYNVYENSSDRAAKIFYENIRSLNLIDSNNVFRFSTSNSEVNVAPAPQSHIQQPENIKPPSSDDDLFELPIPLPKKRKAILRYPLDNLTKKDILVIRKAIDFIESSIEDDEDIL